MTFLVHAVFLVSIFLSPECDAIMGSPPKNLPPCQNKGTWTESPQERYVCPCSGPGMDALCRLVTVNLDGNDVIEFSTTAVQLNSTDQQGVHIGFRFITADEKGDGILFTIDVRNMVSQLKVHLHVGTLQISFGNITRNASVLVRSLSDNTWHNVDLFLQLVGNTYLDIDILTDRCKIDSETGCFQQLRFPVPQSSIELGPLVKIGPFSGCFDKLRINRKIVDLLPETWGKFSRRGCPKAESGCNQGGVKVCGEYGLCQNALTMTSMYTCRCMIGYKPNTTFSTKPELWPCYQESTVWSTTGVDYRGKFTLKHPFTFRLSMRTRTLDFTMFAIVKWDIILNATNGVPQLTYQENQIILPEVNVSDGNWHNFEITFTSRFLDMSVDELDGVFYDSRRYLARTIPTGPADIVIASSAANTCLDDAWVDFGGWRPNFEQDYPLVDVPSLPSRLVNWDQVGKALGCSKGTSVCQTTNPCHNHTTCIDEWRGYRCDCIAGWTRDETGECVAEQCFPNPCKHGQCQPSNNITQNFTCSCYPQWTGELCDSAVDVAEAGLAWWWILLILLLIILITIIIVISICCCIKRRKQNKQFDDLRIGFEDQQMGKETQPIDAWESDEKDFIGAINYSMLETKPDLPDYYLNQPDVIAVSQTPQPVQFQPHSPAVLMDYGQKTTDVAPWEKADDLPNSGLQLDQVLEYGYEGIDGTPPPELRAADDCFSEEDSDIDYTNQSEL